MNWGEFWRIILGEMAPEHFLAYFALMVAGAFIYFSLDVNQAIRKDNGTPTTFKWGFMVRDNAWRILGSLIVMMASVRFYKQFFGVEINAQLAFMNGLGIDALVGTVLKKGKQGPLKKSRDKLIQRYR